MSLRQSMLHGSEGNLFSRPQRRSNFGTVDDDGSDTTASSVGEVIRVAAHDEGGGGEWSILSPGYLEPLVVRGVAWPSLERWVLGNRMARPADREAIRTAQSASRAQEMAKKMETRANWSEYRDSVMLEGIRIRCTQFPEFAAALEATAPLTIVLEDKEGEDDEEWARYGELLVQVRGEQNLPDYVPRELFDDPSAFDESFHISDFVSRLCHRLFEQQKHANIEAECFQTLFKGSIHLLEKRQCRCEQVLSRQEVHMQAIREQYYHTLLAGGVLSKLDAVDEQLGAIQESMGTVVNCTVATGEMLSVMDRQLQRAKEAKEVLSHFDRFNEVSANDMAEATRLMERLRAVQRQQMIDRKMDKIEKLRIQATEYPGDTDGVESDSEDDDSSEDEDGEVQELKTQISMHKIPVSFMLGTTGSGCTRSYEHERGICESLNRLLGLVQSWASPKVALGVANVQAYANFMVNQLLDDLQELQEALSKTEVDLSQPSPLLALVRRHFLGPMKSINIILVNLGYGYRTVERYVSGVFHRLQHDARGSSLELSIDGKEWEGQDVPPKLDHLLSKVSECLKRQYHIVTNIFESPSIVLKRIIDRFLHESGSFGLKEQATKLLEEAMLKVADARRVMDCGQDIRTMHDSIQQSRKQGCPMSPRTAGFHNFVLGLPTEMRETYSILHRTLDSFSAKLHKLHKCFQTFCTATAASIPDCAEPLASLLDSIFSEPMLTYQLTKVEERCLESYFATHLDINATNTDRITVVRCSLHACQTAMERVSSLCKSPRKEHMIDSLYCVLVRGIGEYIKKVIAKRMGPLADDLRKGSHPIAFLLDPKQSQSPSNRTPRRVSIPELSLPSTPSSKDGGKRLDPHNDMLAGIWWAVTAIEMLDEDIRNVCLPQLGDALAKVRLCRNEVVAALQRCISDALTSCCGAIAARSLTILKAQQKKGDFNPSKGSSVHSPTPACSAFCAYLRTQLDDLSHALYASPDAFSSAADCLSFLLARGVYAHYKAQTVTEEGALQLKRDATEIYSTLSVLGESPVAPFDLLREAGNLLLVPAGSLEAVLRESKLATELSQDNLTDLLKMRKDWKENARKFQEALAKASANAVQ